MHALVFDSGVGGLSVVAELRALMPKLHLSYVADDGFRPYGAKSAHALKTRLPGLLKTLVLMLKPDVVVLACNTASTTALDEIRAEIHIPVIGVVPAIKPAAQLSKTKIIAVLGTPGTVRRRYVDRLIKEHADGAQIILHGSTVLVELAEMKLAGQDVDLDQVRAEIAPMFSEPHGAKIDIIVLACTHFPLLVDELKKTTPHAVNWIDSGAAIARRTQSILQSLPRTSTPNHPQISFSIAGKDNKTREHMFTNYGFTKTVVF